MDKQSSQTASRAKQLKEILSKIGHTRFPEDVTDVHRPYDFSNPQSPTYFCVEIELALKSSDALADLINARLTQDKVPASVRVIGINEEEHKRGNEMAKYTFEIIPQEDARLPSDFSIPPTKTKEESLRLKRKMQMEYATQEGITILPRVLKDLHMKGALNEVLYRA